MEYAKRISSYRKTDNGTASANLTRPLLNRPWRTQIHEDPERKFTGPLLSKQAYDNRSIEKKTAEDQSFFYKKLRSTMAVPDNNLKIPHVGRNIVKRSIGRN